MRKNIAGNYEESTNPASDYCFISSFNSGAYLRGDQEAGKIVWENPTGVSCGDEYKPYYEFNYMILMRADKRSDAGGGEIYGQFKYTDICATGELVVTSDVSGEFSVTTNVANSEGASTLSSIVEHHVNGANYGHCTEQLESYLQMNVDGDWRTIIDTGANYASISADAADNYIDNWLKTTSSTVVGSSSARANVKIDSNPPSNYGAYALKDPLRVEMRHLVTAPWLPAGSNSITEAWTMVLKYECEDNLNFVPTWSGTSYTAGTSPDFKYVVNANSGAASTAI